MSKKPFLAYANQPIIFYDGSYFVEHSNFVDFICFWANQCGYSRILVPVEKATRVRQSWTKLHVDKEKVVELKAYSSHFGALVCAVPNVFTLLREIKQAQKESNVGSENEGAPLLILPSPTAFTALFSFFIPRGIKLALFVRGDGEKTLRHIYKRKWFYGLVSGLHKQFLKRTHRLQALGAVTFCFGEELVKKYQPYGPAYSVTPLLRSVDRSGKRSVTRSLELPLKLGFVGRYSHEKGVLDLIEALNLLHLKGLKNSFTFAGHGPLEPLLNKNINCSALTETVNNIGRLTPGEAVREFISSIDLLVLPSKTEGVPRVIAEALNEGVAVAATPVGGIPAAFSECVFLFDGVDVEDIVRGLEYLIINPTEIQKLQNTSEHVVQKFEFSHNLKQISGYLDQSC